MSLTVEEVVEVIRETDPSELDRLCILMRMVDITGNPNVIIEAVEERWDGPTARSSLATEMVRLRQHLFTKTTQC